MAGVLLVRSIRSKQGIASAAKQRFLRIDLGGADELLGANGDKRLIHLPCSAALPRFAAAGSPQPGSLRFRGFAPQCPGRRSLPPAPTHTAFRTVPSVPRWLALLLFPAPALLTAPCSSCRISLLMAYSSPSWF